MSGCASAQGAVDGLFVEGPGAGADAADHLSMGEDFIIVFINPAELGIMESGLCFAELFKEEPSVEATTGAVGGGDAIDHLAGGADAPGLQKEEHVGQAEGVGSAFGEGEKFVEIWERDGDADGFGGGFCNEHHAWIGEESQVFGGFGDVLGLDGQKSPVVLES